LQYSGKFFRVQEKREGGLTANCRLPTANLMPGVEETKGLRDVCRGNL